MLRFALLFALPVALCGCPNTDPAVFVDPTISSPEATLGGSVLGIELTGSCSLDLHLGARAAGSSYVTLDEFSLVTASDKSPIVTPLPVTTSPELPLTVDQDSDVVVAITFDTGNSLLPSSDKDAICAPGGVVIQGAIDDSLADAPTPVFSAAFDPSGC